MTGQKKKVSLKDIAAEAGVSTSLVSFVLNGKAKEHRVSKQMTHRIEEIAVRMNYRPNATAKSLRTAVSRNIGVVVSDISNPFFAHIARHIESEAESRGYTVHFASSDENAERAEHLVDTLLYRGADGIILVPCDGSEKTVGALVEKQVPLVLLDRGVESDVRTNIVCLNNRKAAYDVTMHLISEGFSSIGIIAYNMNVRNMAERVNGYCDAMNEAGLGEEIAVYPADHSDMSGSCSHAVDTLAAKGVQAVILASNNITVESLRHMQAAGIRVPEEMAVFGFDGGSAFDFFYSPLSYLEQPLEEMARLATGLLIDSIENRSKDMATIELEGTLNIRASSRNVRKA